MHVGSDRLVPLKRKFSLTALHDQKGDYVGQDVFRFCRTCSPSPQRTTLLAILFRHRAFLLEKIASNGFVNMKHHAMVGIRKAHLTFENRSDLTWAAMTRMPFADVHATLAIKQPGKIDRGIAGNGFVLFPHASIVSSELS